MLDFVESLQPFGADRNQIIRLADGGPQLLPYAALLRARQADPELELIEAVYEGSDGPLAFFVDAAALREPDILRRLRRRIALRGDAPFLGVVEPGRLSLFEVGLDDGQAPFELETVREDDPAALATFARLAIGDVGPATQTDAVTRTLLRLLADGTSALTKCGLAPLDGISLVGRALFTRFLADRGLLPERLKQEVTTLFSDPLKASGTSAWLDRTFNGDFLPLRGMDWTAIPAAGYSALTNVLFRAAGGQLHLGWDQQGWGYLDFAHVPVGVLSRAYEAHVRSHDPEGAKDDGVYYTPPAIAERMVRESFVALARDGRASGARVLDPAVGAGVFLLASYRELVAARWKADGKRPGTHVLRQILYRQLAGFDVSEEALRFAALGLYLMAIELDPEPQPVEKLGFTNLRGTVLFNARGHHVGRCAGSLGPEVGPEHVGRYDLVIGNPPWTGGTAFPKAEWAQISTMVARVAQGLGLKTPPPVPNQVQDLPFVWRATEWCQPGGRISLVLHGRVLFQQGDGMPEARRALFSSVDVTGIVNGAELRFTRVWPGVSAPFCLLFAVNRFPGPASAFRYVSPHIEHSLNDRGRMRIDASRAPLVAALRVQEEPYLFKVLFRGTELDRELLRSVADTRPTTLSAYWRERFGAGRDGRANQTGMGFQNLRRSSRIRNGEPAPGEDAHKLWKYALLPKDAGNDLQLDTRDLGPFRLARVHHARDEDIYQAPLLLVRQSPQIDHGRISVTVSDDPVVYSESVYGYSAAGHPRAGLLVRYVALLVTSRVALWYLLVTSGKFGFERPSVEKATFDQLPIVPFEDLPGALATQIDSIFEAVVARPDEASYRRLDVWAAQVFGLTPDDLDIVNDTLDYHLPFARAIARAAADVTRSQADSFAVTLKNELEPWLNGEPLSVTNVLAPSRSPWEILCLQAGGSPQAMGGSWPQVARAADAVGATEIIVEAPDRQTLWLGRLRQARHWTRSQARLCARHLIWRHIHVLLPQRSNQAAAEES